MKCRLKGPHSVVLACWKYDPTAPIPIWVVRSFHKLGSEAKLEGISAVDGSIQTAKPGDWILGIDEEGGPVYAVAITAEEFERALAIRMGALIKPLREFIEERSEP